MYIPTQFEQPDISVMHELIRAKPLATLVTLASTGINANHIPLHLSEDALPFGVLRGHVARSNPLWADLRSDVEVLAIFHGDDAYISPSWYATKQENHKVVPTWNYTVVHAYGNLRVIEDTSWIRSQLETLTKANEAQFSEPWMLSDAPKDFIDTLVKSVVGIEIIVTKLSGKWKVSQNQPLQNQLGVIQGLNANGQTESAALVSAGIK